MYDCKPCKTPLEVNFKIATNHKSTRTNTPYREAERLWGSNVPNDTRTS
jgi:hypothetical protein